jgi:putative addiction module component (TIGR02574 family)
MSTTLQNLGIDRLTRAQRIVLVQETWDTIAAEPRVPLLSETNRQELERRVADDNAHPDDLIPWEEVKAEALERLKS